MKETEEKRRKRNIKKQTITAVQETDNIFKQVIKSKGKVDGVAHGIQYEEFKLALLRISLLAGKAFREFKQAHDKYLEQRDDKMLKWQEDHPEPTETQEPLFEINKKGEKLEVEIPEANKERVNAFEGLLVVMDIPGDRLEQNKKWRKIMEKRNLHFPPKMI